jgi:YfiH family protein
MDDAEAIGAVDAIFAQGGLEHGRRLARPKADTGNHKQQPNNGTRSSRTDILPSGQASRRRPKAIQAGVLEIADWSRFPWLRAGFSTREGGESTAYSDGDAGHAEQNLGWTTQDPAVVVAANRRRFVQALSGTNEMELVTMRQFHSGMMRVMERGGIPLSTPEGKAVLRGDGLLTSEAGLLLGVQTADCVPVLIADTRTRAVAAFHAGWRGTLARITERGIGAMQLQFGSRPSDLIAAIGPAIGPCCFAVGEEVRFEFESQFAYAPELFSEVYDSDLVRQKYPMLFLTARAPGHSNLGPQIHLNLWEANRRQLLDAGLKPKAITVAGECTACTRLRNGQRKYFSHRDERGFTGRMLSAIGVTQKPVSRK